MGRGQRAWWRRVFGGVFWTEGSGMGQSGGGSVKTFLTHISVHWLKVTGNRNPSLTSNGVIQGYQPVHSTTEHFPEPHFIPVFPSLPSSRVGGAYFRTWLCSWAADQTPYAAVAKPWWPIPVLLTLQQGRFRKCKLHKTTPTILSCSMS